MKQPQPTARPSFLAYPTSLAIILLGALLVRLWGLGRAGLWQDEMGFVNFSRTDLGVFELARVAREYILSVGQMPLAFLMQNVYLRALGEFIPGVDRAAFWLRLPSVIWGVLAVAGVYRMVSAVADEKRAHLAAVLFSLMFFPIYYSREVYCYAPIMASAVWMTACAVRQLSPGGHPWKSAVASALWAILLVFTHLNGAIYFCCLAGVVGCYWLYALVRPRGAAPFASKTLALLLVLWTIVLLLVMPYLLRFVFENKAHMGQQAPPLFLILQDPVAKMFFGERLPLLVLSWGVFLLGLGAALRRGGGTALLSWVGLLAWLLIAFMTSRSQYWSVRYFTPIAPVFCVFLMEALFALSAFLSRRLARPQVPLLVALTALIVLGHGVFFLWPMYHLPDKDLGFGRIAAWLNSRLPPGSTYLMESAYELRWVSGYHPTPGLVGAAPYVHGSGPGEAERLHQRQQAFMERFPEAPFVESAHHDILKPQGLWTWPHTFHPQRERMVNQPLRDLIKRGIFIGVPLEKIYDHSYAADIYYSTPEDIDQRARRQGQLARLDYPGWTAAQIAQGEYRRALPGRTGRLTVRRLTPEPTRVRLALRAALDADPAVTYTLIVARDGRELLRAAHPGGQWWTLQGPELALDQEQADDVTLTIEGYPAPRALVLDEAVLAPVVPRPGAGD